MNVVEAIEEANKLLPGQPAPESEIDPRWQAIIAVSDFIESHPEEVWRFAFQWGCHADEDLQDAIATCLLEHLLEHHFSRIFPYVEEAVKTNAQFADTFNRSWKFGQACESPNASRFDHLKSKCNRKWQKI